MRAATAQRRRGRSLLVVEDDDATREALELILAREGYAVTMCTNGREALESLRSGAPPSAILLDLMMPVMDGWQFRVEQKRDPVLAKIPVVALSADETSKAAAIDADAHLRKPVDFDALLDTIDLIILDREHAEIGAKLAQTDRLRSLGTLAAGVAHEINNPLAFVLLNLSEISDQLPDLLDPKRLAAGDEAALEARKERLTVALGHARTGIDRIRAIVHGLKTFSRVEDESRGPVDVRKPLESSIGLVANELRHRARLVKNLDTVPLVEANEARLGQLFLNLLLNAAQALPDGDAPHHEVRVSLRSPSPERVLVEIADTGVGIAPDVCERIFEPFFTTKAVGVGTGLGLSICHGIVSSFGGKISVTSEVGKGSVFRVELPIASASTQDDPPSQRQPPPSSRRHRACIAVIDDEPIICSTLKRLLSKEYDVEAFTDARSALERIRGGMRFDVLLCDLMMPEMDGPALYEELRSGDFDQASRVIFLTGGAFTTRAQEFLRSVPNKRLDKPTGIVTLKSILREHLSRTDGEST